MMMGGAPHRKIEIPTLGVEEEYQIVNAADARARVGHDRAPRGGRGDLRHAHPPEFHSPVVEVVTTVCQNTKEIGEQLSELRRTMIGARAQAEDDDRLGLDAPDHALARRQLHPERALPPDHEGPRRHRARRT